MINGLGPAIAALVAATRVPDYPTRCGSWWTTICPAGFGASGAPSAEPAAIGLACARELLHNALKHARTSTIRIETAYAGRQMVVRVVDDGAGFDPDTVLPERRRVGHLGIALVGERLEQVGGRLEVESRPGAGTRVTCSAPIAPRRPSGTSRGGRRNGTGR